MFFDKTELFYHSSHAHNESTPNVAGANVREDSFLEMECASSALFTMLDTGEPSRPPKRTKEDATYQCDMCPKTFHILNALQVHRGWHFRSPDGRKVRNPNDIWQPDQLAPSKVKRMSQAHRSPSTYAATVNPIGEKGLICGISSTNETSLECSPCKIKLPTKSKWIEHKLLHAKTQNPGITNKFDCDICNISYSSRELLLQHIPSHLTSSNMLLNSGAHTKSTSNNGDYDQAEHVTIIKQEKPYIKEEQGEDMQESDSEEAVATANQSVHEKEDKNQNTSNEEKEKGNNTQYSCELCQVHFNSANALRQHVSEHFVNGGFGANIQLSNKTKEHRSSTDSSSSSSSTSSSDTTSSGENNSSDDTCDTQSK